MAGKRGDLAQMVASLNPWEFGTNPAKWKQATRVLESRSDTCSCHCSLRALQIMKMYVPVKINKVANISKATKSY